MTIKKRTVYAHPYWAECTFGALVDGLVANGSPGESAAFRSDVIDALHRAQELVTHATSLKPLSDIQIDDALQTDPMAILALMDPDNMSVESFKSMLRRVARAVERAHGIDE